MQAKLPLWVFLGLCVAFLVVEGLFHVINRYYVGVHFYFGLSFPLLWGYCPYRLFAWNGWRHLPVNRAWTFGWRWSIRAGVAGTFLMSFINEVIDDPKQNGVPFLQAWHHFAADMAGIVVFAILYRMLLRGMFSGPNPPLNTDAGNKVARAG